MKYFENLLVFLSCAFVAQAQDLTTLVAEPLPGALSLYFNATGLDNLFQTAVPIGAYFGLNGRTFNSTLEKKTWLYELALKSVTINGASGFTEKVLDYDRGTNTIHIRIAGIDLQTLVDAEFKAFDRIPFESSAVNVTNITVDFKVDATPSADKIHWKLIDTVELSIGDVSIDMKTSALNWLVHRARGLINKAIDDALVPYLKRLITDEVNALNSAVSGEGPYTFTINAGGKDVGLNLTMPTAPRAVGSTDLIEIFFDGLFVPAKGSGLVPKVDFRNAISQYPPRIADSLSQQIWIHENFFNSLLELNPAALFPWTWESDVVSSAIYSAFPSVNLTCEGGQAGVGYSLHKSKSTTDKAVTMSRTNGIVFGSNNIRTTVDIFCAKNKAHVYSFSSLIRAELNSTMHNFMLYSAMNKHEVSATVLESGNLDGTKEYNKQLTDITNTFVTDFNKKYLPGWSLANLNPMLAMAAGLIKNSTATPWVTDSLLFAGLDMQADLSDAGSPVLEFMQ